MNKIIQSRKIPVFLTLVWLLASCSSHLYVQKTNPQHYVISDQQVDSQIVKTILPYKMQLDGKMHEIIGLAPVALQKKTPESNLGNFFAEAIFQKVKKLALTDSTHTFAFFNSGGLRTSVPQGNVLVGSMYELMPFENKLVMIQVNGDRLQKLLDYIAEKDGAPVAGIRMVLAEKKAQNIFINGVPFDPKATYYVATSDYLAGGGDKFFSPQEKNPLIKTEILLRDILIDYCKDLTKQNKPVTANLDGRIQYAK